MQFKKNIPASIVAIADFDLLGPGLFNAVEACVRGGVSWICLRAKNSDSLVRVKLGAEIRERCPSAFLSINGDPEACRRLNAQGLHLPSRGFDVRSIRMEFPQTLLGVSCHSRKELEAAERSGVDYAFLSPVFAPVSKKVPSIGVLGVEGFAEMTGGLAMPVFALAGATPEKLKQLAKTPAAGIAVCGSLFNCSDVETRAIEYSRELKQLDFSRVFRYS